MEEHKACTERSNAGIGERARRCSPPTGVLGRAAIGHGFNGSVQVWSQYDTILQARRPSTAASSTVTALLRALSRLAHICLGGHICLGVLSRLANIRGPSASLSERSVRVDCWARAERWFHPEQVRGQHHKRKDANVEEEGVR